MTITRADVADLQPGDVVEVVETCCGDEITTRGPVRREGDYLNLGDLTLLRKDGEPAGWYHTLTVVSRALRLYVNHPRTEPFARDVAVADSDKLPYTFIYDGNVWRDQHGEQWGLSAARLRLLIDGETGQVVP